MDLIAFFGRSNEAVAHGAKHIAPTVLSFMKVASSIQKRKMVHFYCGASSSDLGSNKGHTVRLEALGAVGASPLHHRLSRP